MEAGGRAADLAAVGERARACRACPLWEIGTQTVFGEGPVDAGVLFVGEAPGAQEDRTGRPFVGPAGRMFDEGLERAGIERSRVYVTNAVKHRPWEQSGARQKNRPPRASEIRACRPWLEAELDLIRPAVICCLGAVAGRAILGPDFKLMAERGNWRTSPHARHVLATVHPSFVIIQPADSLERWRRTFFDDLALVADRLAELRRGGALRAAS
jgi:DNA polymerase